MNPSSKSAREPAQQQRGHIGFVSFFIATGQAGLGGSEQLWFEAARQLHRQGYRLSFHDRFNGASPPPWSGLGTRDDLIEPPARSLGARLLQKLFNPSAGQHRPASNLRLERQLHRQRPDLLVLNLGGHLQGTEEAAAALHARVPYVLIVQHVNDVHWPSNSGDEAFVTLYTKAAACLFVSRANQTSVEAMLGQALPQAAVIHNPCRLLGEPAVPWPSSSTPWRMALPARLDVQDKGQDLLLQVMARPHWRQQPLELHCFGQGRHSRALLRRRDQLGLSSTVFFHAHHQEPSQLWANHHLAVFASRAEGMSLAMLEAMAATRPVLSTAVAGHPEVIREGSNGFLASCACADSLDEAMQRAWQAREQWQSMGKRARADLLEAWPRDPAADLAHRLSAMLPAVTPHGTATPC